MGGAHETIFGILHMGMGQSPSDSPHVLHQFLIFTRGLLPHNHLQSQGLPKHYCEPRFALYEVGQSAKPTPHESNI